MCAFPVVRKIYRTHIAAYVMHPIHQSVAWCSLFTLSVGKRTRRCMASLAQIAHRHRRVNVVCKTELRLSSHINQYSYLYWCTLHWTCLGFSAYRHWYTLLMNELNRTTTSGECKCMGHTHRNIVRRRRRTLYYTQMLTRCMHVHCMHASACVCAAGCHAPKHRMVQPCSASQEARGHVNALLG